MSRLPLECCNLPFFKEVIHSRHMAPSCEAETECFYKANIHERRVAAYLCRAFPLACVVTVAIFALYGAFYEQVLLLVLTAMFNILLWTWVVSMALISIHAALFKLNDLDICPQPSPVIVNTAPVALTDTVPMHLIIIANYTEDESVLADTLRSLSEAEGSRAFWVVLAMEAREGDEGTEKGERLRMRFASEFARLVVHSHPANLVQSHEDGSENMEIPGKSSNLKYAVEQSYKECVEAGVHLDLVILTTGDADCIFHPMYFSQVGKDFQALRSKGEHEYAMWQAPQFPYRNFFTSPIVSRVWGYLASTYEFGGVSSTAWGGHQMAFSSFSMPLLLGYNADAWDGDVIADDHHCWLKCFYFSLYRAAHRLPQKLGSKAAKKKMEEATLAQMRPIFLPVKSTLVEAEEWWMSWVERWSQAKRHAQGVAELPYALLATYDALRSCVVRRRMLSFHVFMRMSQALARLFCMHILPICQAICLATLSVKWFLGNKHIAMCPDKLSFFFDFGSLWNIPQSSTLALDMARSDEQFLLCGLAGAWVLVWPMVIPWALIVISNYLVMRKVFLGPAVANRSRSLWHSEDGKSPTKYAGCKAFGQILFDTVFGMSWILVPYGLVVELMAYVRVLFCGNDFNFTSAMKPTAPPVIKHGQLSTYGAVQRWSADGRPIMSSETIGDTCQ